MNLANTRYPDSNLNSNWICDTELLDPFRAERNVDFHHFSREETRETRIRDVEHLVDRYGVIGNW